MRDHTKETQLIKTVSQVYRTWFLSWFASLLLTIIVVYYLLIPLVMICFSFIQFENDTVIVPKESSWFGFYPDGDLTHVLPVQETKLYIEDWIGLKALVVAGKVQFVNVTGDHLIMADEDLVKYVVPLLQDQQSAAPRLNRKTKEPLHP